MKNRTKFYEMQMKKRVGKEVIENATKMLYEEFAGITKGMSKEEFNEALYSYESHDEYSEKYHLWCATRWREIIEEMATLIEEVNKYEQEYGEELEEMKDKALALFGKYFFYLWF